MGHDERKSGSDTRSTEGVTRPLPLQTPAIAFLLDVDNTLLDNDLLKNDLAMKVEALVGQERAKRFWELYEVVRQEEDYVDYPTTVARWTAESGSVSTGRMLQELLDTMPFRDYVYPHVPDTIAYLWTIGSVAILSDGDPVFQPLKIRNSGLEAAVHGNVLVYVHKEEQLLDVFRRIPATHYVVVDDKPRILAALERDCPTTFTTVMVLQGRYAVEGEFKPSPDIIVPHIGELRNLSATAFAGR